MVELATEQFRLMNGAPKIFEWPCRASRPAEMLKGRRCSSVCRILTGSSWCALIIRIISGQLYISALDALAKKRTSQLVVLDRPNPECNGVTTEGPPLDSNYKSLSACIRFQCRHGKTIGELAQQFRDEAFSDCQLSVLPMKAGSVVMWFDQTGLPWVMPVTEHAGARYRNRCILECAYWRHKHLRRSRHDTAIRKSLARHSSKRNCSVASSTI